MKKILDMNAFECDNGNNDLDDIVQDCINSIAKAMELLQSCT